MNNEEEITYRSPAAVAPTPVASSQDERDFSTLLEVQKELHNALIEIDSIHVFDLTEKSLTIKQQIAAYKKARDIVSPVAQRVNLAIENVQEMQKERSS